MARLIPAYYYDQLSKDPRHPLLNNAIQSEYPPGSMFKLSAANGALNEGVVSGPNQVIFAPGKLELCEQFTPNEPCGPNNTRPFVDWIYDTRPEGFRRRSTSSTASPSPATCASTSWAADFEDEIPNGGLGIFRLGEYARALGYGARSGIELPGEARGLIPDPRWKRINQGENWSTGDTYIATVGQGYVLATPLQVLMSGATHGQQRQADAADGRPAGHGRRRQGQTVWFSPSDFTLWMPRAWLRRTQARDGETWINLADGSTAGCAAGRKLPDLALCAKCEVGHHNRSTDRRILQCEAGNCLPTGQTKVVDPAVVRERAHGHAPGRDRDRRNAAQRLHRGLSAADRGGGQDRHGRVL